MIEHAMKLDEIDPQIAWDRWTPAESEPWDIRRAGLLFRRAGFSASSSMLEKAVQESPESVIEGFFKDEASTSVFESESNDLALAVRATGDAKQLSTWWLHRMLNSPDPLREKLTLFWHGHFATSAEKVIDIDLMFGQNQLLRQTAIGDFRAMVHGISKDPAMLIYLDSATNRKGKANENYARELMELFCLGEGNYTESDVQELARCFTGWEIRRKAFRFNTYQHDSGKKTIFGRSGIESGEEAVDQVLASPHLPMFIARKLFRLFVCDEPAPTDRLLAPLATRFSDDNLQIKGIVEMILRSRLMLSGWSIGRKIKSPVELAIGFLYAMDGSTNLDRLSRRLREIGQSVFYPPNVKGWDGGRSWINSSTLVGRANLIHQILRDESTRFQKQTLNDYLTSRVGGSLEKMIDWIGELLIPVAIPTIQRSRLLESVAGKPRTIQQRELLSLVAAVPQFQLS